MPTQAFVEEVNELARKSCTFVGFDESRPYVKGQFRGQARRVYDINPTAKKLWDVCFPYVYQSVKNSQGNPESDEGKDVISSIKMNVMTVLRDFGPDGLKGGFISILKLVVNNILTNGAQIYGTQVYAGYLSEDSVEDLSFATRERIKAILEQRWGIIYTKEEQNLISKSKENDTYLKRLLQAEYGEDWQSYYDYVVKLRANSGRSKRIPSMNDTVLSDDGGQVELYDLVGKSDENVAMFEFIDSIPTKDRKVVEAVITAGSIVDATRMLNGMEVKITATEVKRIAEQYV